MKNVILIGLLIFFAACTAPLNQEKENLDGETILIGSVTWEGLTKEPYDEWFTTNYLGYDTDNESLNMIEQAMNELEITVFLGSWCEDSQVQVPQFYKMLDQVGYDISSLNVIALERLENRDLVGPAGEEEGFNISHVPTFIFYKDGIELGRIVEYPTRTIEKDMVEIILGK